MAEKDFMDSKISSSELEEIKLNCLGKRLHPETFQNCICRKAYQDCLDQLQGTEVDVINKGAFIYPEA